MNTTSLAYSPAHHLSTGRRCRIRQPSSMDGPWPALASVTPGDMVRPAKARISDGSVNMETSVVVDRTDGAPVWNGNTQLVKTKFSNTTKMTRPNRQRLLVRGPLILGNRLLCPHRNHVSCLSYSFPFSKTRPVSFRQTSHRHIDCGKIRPLH